MTEVVHGGVTQRAGHAQPRDVVVRVHGGLDAHDGIHLEEGYRRGGTLEIDLVENSRGQNVGVHLEPDFQRGGRIHGLLDDLVQAKLVGPELLVAEGLEAEHPLALCNELG
jgi:hypothetical protein